MAIFAMLKKTSLKYLILITSSQTQLNFTNIIQAQADKQFLKKAKNPHKMLTANANYEIDSPYFLCRYPPEQIRGHSFMFLYIYSWPLLVVVVFPNLLIVFACTANKLFLYKQNPTGSLRTG